MTNDDFLSKKIPHFFCCEKCNYNTSVKKDFNKHLLTLKHKNRENSDQENNLSQPTLFICNCGKKYKYKQGLSLHKKKCEGEKKEDIVLIPDNKDDMKELVLKLINQNSELQKTIHDLIPKVGNNNNSNNTINNKNKFNIIVFLN